MAAISASTAHPGVHRACPPAEPRPTAAAMKPIQDRVPPPGPVEPLDITLSEDMITPLMDLFHRFGDLYRFYAPSTQGHLYVLSHPEHAKRVLITNYKNYVKGFGIDRVKILLGHGIMTSEGDFWHRQRRMIQPAFHRTILSRLSADGAGKEPRAARTLAQLQCRGRCRQPGRGYEHHDPRPRARFHLQRGSAAHGRRARGPTRFPGHRGVGATSCSPRASGHSPALSRTPSTGAGARIAAPSISCRC